MKTPITVAMVGTRRAVNAQRDQVGQVLAAMIRAGADELVLTGHAGGICADVALLTWKVGIRHEVCYPKYQPGQTHLEATKALYERDRLLVEAADLVLAWPALDRRGGTEEEIRQSKRQGRPCLLCVGPPPWSWAGVAPDLVPAWLAGLVLPPMAVQATLITA